MNMKKFLIGICLVISSVASYAGIVEDHGKKYMTKITTKDRDNHIKFQSTFPKVSFRVRKQDIIKAMLKIGSTTTIGELERNGILLKGDRKLLINLRRKHDGLIIQSGNVSMFVTERELEKVKK